MKVYYNERFFPFDVDKTLISKRRAHAQPGDMCVINPYTKKRVYFKPNNAMIDLLIESYGRGRLIAVWTASGVLWAKTIIDALKIEKYVHFVVTKPDGYADDKAVNEWMNNRVFIDESDRE